MAVFSDEDFEDLKEVVKGIVLLFRTIWEEVEHQFSDRPKEERYQIFSMIAPLITAVLAKPEIEDVAEDSAKLKGKRRGTKVT